VVGWVVEVAAGRLAASGGGGWVRGLSRGLPSPDFNLGETR
jgi:hypothetical protein